MSAVWAALGAKPREVIRIWGMRRSGNHAVINWMMRNAPEGGALFLNDCKPKGHPLETLRAVELDGQRINPQAYGGLEGVAAALGDGFTLMYSHEDRVPEFGSTAPQLQTGVPDEAVDREIIIYRSFLNWASSLLKKIQRNSGFDSAARQRIMTRSVRRYFRILELTTGQPRVRLDAISYDRWITSEAYRAKCLAALDFPRRDNTLGAQQKFGGGSSFRDTAPDAAALAARWTLMQDDAEFRALLRQVRGHACRWATLAQHFPEDAARIEEMGDL